MRIHQLSVEEALASLHSGPDGIGDAEAKRRLSEFGPNQVERVEATPLVVRFLHQFTHFFALVLWFAAALAMFAEIHQPGEGMGALAIVGVILINGLFSFWQEYRSESTLSALRDLLPQMVAVEREGALIELPASELVPGDVIRLHEGDSVPAVDLHAPPVQQPPHPRRHPGRDRDHSTDRLHGSGQFPLRDRTGHVRGVAVCPAVRPRHAGHGRGPEMARAPEPIVIEAAPPRRRLMYRAERSQKGGRDGHGPARLAPV